MGLGEITKQANKRVGERNDEGIGWYERHNRLRKKFWGMLEVSSANDNRKKSASSTASFECPAANYTKICSHRQCCIKSGLKENLVLRG